MKDWFEEELVRINLPNDEWIDITKYETEEHHEQLLSLMGKPVQGKPTNVAGVGVDLGETRKLTLVTRIRCWSFKDKEGNPLPVTPENIARLPRIMTDRVMMKINKMEEEDFLALSKEKN